MAIGGTTYGGFNWDDTFQQPKQQSKAAAAPGRHWNGSGWVDDTGASVGSDTIGNVGTPYSTGNEWLYRDDMYQFWNRARGGLSALLYDYFLKDLPQVRKNQETRQDLFNQYTNTLNGAQEANRAYTNTMATGARSAEEAAIAALSMGMDPKAAAMSARNSASMAAHDAAGRAWDPQARAERIANAMGMAKDVSDPMYRDMLALIMQYDTAINGANVQDNADDGGFWGDVIGAIGGIGSAYIGKH